MTDKIHIVIIDDHPLFRDGVVHTLSTQADIEIVGEGTTAEEAVKLATDLLPDLILLDIDIPGGGINAAQTIAAAYPVIKIIMLTVSEEEDHVVAALKAGARAYILKGISARELISIVRSVWAGEGYVTPTLAASLLSVMSRALPDTRPATGTASNPNKALDELTEREREILEQVAAGYSNKEIGLQLHLTEKTVKHYMTNILQKLQVRNRVEAALLAQKAGRAEPKA